MRTAILIASLLLASNAYAIDPECVDPPPLSGPNVWPGEDGTLAYCTPINVPTTCVPVIDGAEVPDGKTTLDVPVGTRIVFSVADRVGQPPAPARVSCANADGLTSEVMAANATFPPAPLPAPLPAVLLAN
jgi:hypothetical protein